MRHSSQPSIGPDPFQRLRVRDTVQGMVPNTLLHVLSEYLLQQGVAPTDVIPADAPLAEGDPLRRFPAEAYCQMLLRAAELLQDPALGLHLGQAIRPAHLGALGYALLNCENLGALLLRTQRYHRLLNDINPIEHRVVGDALELVWGVAHGKPGALFDEFGVTAFVEFARLVCDTRAPVSAVDFVNPPPADPRPFKAYFGCPVRWGQPLTRLALPLALLQTPLRRADPMLRRLMEAQVDKVMASLPDAGELGDMTCRIVTNLAPHGMPELEQVAAALRLSPRVYYRRLAEQGLNFRQLRDATLREMAQTHLADDRLSVAEVAGLLGYTEPSAFTRAFRRWTGSSPLQWRQGRRQ